MALQGYCNFEQVIFSRWNAGSVVIGSSIDVKHFFRRRLISFFAIYIHSPTGLLFPLILAHDCSVGSKSVLRADSKLRGQAVTSKRQPKKITKKRETWIRGRLPFFVRGQITWKIYTPVRPWVETVPELRQGRSSGEQGVANGRVVFSQYDGSG